MRFQGVEASNWSATCKMCASVGNPIPKSATKTMQDTDNQYGVKLDTIEVSPCSFSLGESNLTSFLIYRSFV